MYEVSPSFDELVKQIVFHVFFADTLSPKWPCKFGTLQVDSNLKYYIQYEKYRGL